MASRCAVLWDIDGTLCDSFELAFDATNRALTTNGFGAIPIDEYKAFTIYTTPVRLARHARLAPGTAEFDAVGAKLGAQFDADYIALVTPASAPIFAGLRAVVDGLEALGDDRIRLGCLTNAAVGYADAVIRAHGLGGAFLTIHGADSVPAAKPAPEGLLKCASEVGVALARCCYVGDSPTDGQAARAANFGLAVGVAFDDKSAHTRESIKDHFDVVVDTVADLERVLLDFVADPSAKVVVPNDN